MHRHWKRCSKFSHSSKILLVCSGGSLSLTKELVAYLRSRQACFLSIFLTRLHQEAAQIQLTDSLTHVGWAILSHFSGCQSTVSFALHNCFGSPHILLSVSTTASFHTACVHLFSIFFFMYGSTAPTLNGSRLKICGIARFPPWIADFGILHYQAHSFDRRTPQLANCKMLPVWESMPSMECCTVDGRKIVSNQEVVTADDCEQGLGPGPQFIKLEANLSPVLVLVA